MPFDKHTAKHFTAIAFNTEDGARLIFGTHDTKEQAAADTAMQKRFPGVEFDWVDFQGLKDNEWQGMVPGVEVYDWQIYVIAHNEPFNEERVFSDSPEEDEDDEGEEG